SRGRLEGFGITSEALDDNAVVYELATRALWSPMPPLDHWLPEYAARRWGTGTAEVRAAWDLLAGTLYGPGRTRATPSPLIARPWSQDLPFASQRLAGEPLPTTDGPPSANLDAENDTQMLRALEPLARATGELVPLLARPGRPDALAHDVAQLALHVGAQSARAPLRPMVAAARAAARAWAGDDAPLADALEHDARSLISVWGTQDSGLHDYSARHWSGSLTDLHLARWRAWADWLASGADGAADLSDPEPLRERIRRIEEDWRGATSPYPTTPRGDLAAAVVHLLDLARTQLPRLLPTAPHPGGAVPAAEDRPADAGPSSAGTPA